MENNNELRYRQLCKKSFKRFTANKKLFTDAKKIIKNIFNHKKDWVKIKYYDELHKVYFGFEEKEFVENMFGSDYYLEPKNFYLEVNNCNVKTRAICSYLEIDYKDIIVSDYKDKYTEEEFY